MQETAEDLIRVQRLLDESYQAAGTHLREVITPERMITAKELSEKLLGMRLLVLSTVTKDCRPIGGPVDGIFYRGDFYFGSSPVSTRFLHIKRGSHVTATHLPGEELSVTVHGSATPIDIKSTQHRCMGESMRVECSSSLCRLPEKVNNEGINFRLAQI